MTHEVWLMMLGLNLDLWTQPLIDKAVSCFGRLMIWEEDHFYQSRAVVKVRVTSLDEIPWFLVFIEGTGFESDSWSVQCEILPATMLGGATGDEDFPLVMMILILRSSISMALGSLVKARLLHLLLMKTMLSV